MPTRKPVSQLGILGRSEKYPLPGRGLFGWKINVCKFEFMRKYATLQLSDYTLNWNFPDYIWK